MTRSRHQPGFTLVEVLIACFIATLIFLVGFTAISSTVNARRDSSRRIRGTEAARMLFQALERDLASAYNGPNGLTKSRATGCAFNTTPVSAQLVLTVDPSDALQFYTRADLPTQTDNQLFVRYFHDPNGKAVCRRVINATQSATPPETGPLDADDPATTDENENERYHLINDVDAFQVLFRRWDDAGKTWLPALSDSNDYATPASATHLLVKVRIRDPFADYKGTTEDDKPPAETTRTYYHVIPLPSSLK